MILYIIVEGQTEEEFIKSLLRPYLQSFNILVDVRPIKIQTSKGHKGGFVNYLHLKNDILKLLKQQKEIIVTMFVDFFRIPDNVPNYKICVNNAQTLAKINCLEQGIKNDINNYRFIPYIQLHEFEALLFSSNKGFERYFEINQYSETEKTIKSYSNPENINSNPETTPSKRLLKIKPSYDKVVEGNIIAIEIGIEEMLKKCPRFENWVNQLIKKLSR